MNLWLMFFGVPGGAGEAEVGGWRLETGNWRLEAEPLSWRLEAGGWRLETGMGAGVGVDAEATKPLGNSTWGLGPNCTSGFDLID